MITPEKCRLAVKAFKYYFKSKNEVGFHFCNAWTVDGELIIGLDGGYTIEDLKKLVELAEAVRDEQCVE